MQKRFFPGCLTQEIEVGKLGVTEQKNISIRNTIDYSSSTLNTFYIDAVLQN